MLALLAGAVGRQIKHVLKMDPETALKSGNPGPEVELAFWKSKVSCPAARPCDFGATGLSGP